MGILSSLLNILSALFGLALVLLGGWLWPWGITELAPASIPIFILIKATSTIALSGYGTLHFIRAID